MLLAAARRSRTAAPPRAPRSPRSARPGPARARPSTAPWRSRSPAVRRRRASSPATRRRSPCAAARADPRGSLIAAQSIRPNRRGCRPTKMFSATERSGNSAGCWWTTAMPWRWPSAAPWIVMSAPSSRMSSGIRLMDAAEDFHHRALAGAVFACQRVHPPGVEAEIDVAQHLDRAETLGDPRSSIQRQSAIAPPSNHENVPGAAIAARPLAGDRAARGATAASRAARRFSPRQKSLSLRFSSVNCSGSPVTICPFGRSL